MSRISVVVPVVDMASAAALWERLLGVAPTFVDGDRWAQFDPPSGRVCLAGTDRAADQTALMLKVEPGELATARSELEQEGFTVGPDVVGPHEVRCVASDPAGGVLVVYEPRPAS